jgi:hypothetical protein
MTHDELIAYINNSTDGLKHKDIFPLLLANTQALRAVVELHKPTADGLGCSYEFVDCHDRSGLGCDVPSTCNQYQSYPCPTIKAIEKELA